MAGDNHVDEGSDLDGDIEGGQEAEDHHGREVGERTETKNARESPNSRGPPLDVQMVLCSSILKNLLYIYIYIYFFYLFVCIYIHLFIVRF